MPTLLRSRPVPLQVLLAGVIPLLFGAFCGWLLGVDKTAYLIASAVAAVGAYLAGREHIGALEAAIRGLIGGLLFGAAILLVNDAIGKQPKLTLQHPKIILVAITAVVGAALGALGGRARARKEEEDEEEGTGFDIKRIHRSEIIGFVGAGVLILSLLLLPWFASSCPLHTNPHHAIGCNPNSKVGLASGAVSYGSFTGWETYTYVRWLLLAACIAPFVLAYIIARGHDLSWRPGEVTMIVGMIAFALIMLDGIILGRPGGNNKSAVDISLQIGYPIGLLGAALMAYGGFRRQAENVKPQPPGV